ncbi:hypothetical protein [Halopiger goleimassiliensis]|uniref:hypothetical protein n=1 Tax=Halopiger goleimassiliensis TaxID=1293048 RepID=UPI000677EE77|nr:hypothetical protein [Halopiger goleimassiliensis]
MSAPTDQRGWQDLLELPEFLDQLEERGGLPVMELLEDLNDQADLGLEADGVVYHDRGIRVPGYDATFVHERTGARGRPAFSVEINTVGPRNAWAKFDRTLEWDVYLLRTEGLAAIAWLSDEEYQVEESEMFDSKEQAALAGRFSFGVYCYAGDAWAEQRERIQRTDAPAYLQREDGSVMLPSTQSEFYQLVDSSPTEFRTSGGNAPSYLGVLELEITID